ncbi:hypothetical protein L2E82_11059 [Cichorium intybus]|uniref:Uncharacterized protein n=1 Tax=Cichorium intybus TaxID=13427 RepID=A0ACB9GD94_CICIN|nr:hypothetical protein L2E82_11059 [Cichorium intybus]
MEDGETRVFVDELGGMVDVVVTGVAEGGFIDVLVPKLINKSTDGDVFQHEVDKSWTLTQTTVSLILSLADFLSTIIHSNEASICLIRNFGLELSLTSLRSLLKR